MTGEEVSGGRLFAIDLANRDFYQLSGVAGSASGGLGGMPFDSWENAALVDTGNTSYVGFCQALAGDRVGEPGSRSAGPTPAGAQRARRRIAFLLEGSNQLFELSEAKVPGPGNRIRWDQRPFSLANSLAVEALVQY